MKNIHLEEDILWLAVAYPDRAEALTKHEMVPEFRFKGIPITRTGKRLFTLVREPHGQWLIADIEHLEDGLLMKESPAP